MYMYINIYIGSAQNFHFIKLTETEKRETVNLQQSILGMKSESLTCFIKSTLI